MSAAAEPPAPIPGARLLFSLDPAISYLDNGALGAMPIGVQRAQQRLRDEVEANPVRFHTRGLPERIVHTRRHLAGFLGADPDGTALVANTSAGVAVALQSMRLAPGAEILLTNHRYGAAALAVEREGGRTGAVSRTVDIPVTATDGEIVEAIGRAIRPGRTSLLVIDQVAAPTARLFPVASIIAQARRAGVAVLVDAAHAPGMLPVEVDALGADFWVGSLYKWAFAPRGTALLSVAPRWRAQIEPLVASWGQESGFPLSVELQGTLDYTTWLAAPTGLFTLRTLGVERVRTHNAQLAAYGQRVIGTALGLSPAELPEAGSPLVAMRILPLPGGVATNPSQAVALRERIADTLGAEVAVNSCDGRGWLRICAQVYNRPEEYDRLALRLPALLTAEGG